MSDTPDDPVDELRDLASGNVRAFVTTALGHEVDRRRWFSIPGRSKSWPTAERIRLARDG